MKLDIDSIKDKVTILVVGYDGYKDVWDENFRLMNMNWNDRPRTILANGLLTPEYKNVEIINAGSDAEWSKKVQVAMKSIDTPYVLLLLEDFFIADKVDTDKIYSALQLVSDENIKFYQILVQLMKQSWAEGKAFKNDKHVHIIPSDKKYPVNLQAAIWDSDFLRECVGEENYNAWQFEIRHIDRRVNEDKIEFLIDDTNMLNIVHSVVQSKYLRCAIKSLKKRGYSVDLSKRPMMSRNEEFKYQLKLFMYSVVPKRLVAPAKKIGKLMGVDFVTDRISGKKD